MVVIKDNIVIGNMHTRDIAFKLKWWIKEHLLLYPSSLKDEYSLDYILPRNYLDFAVHPCIRFIKEGFGGYKWWMVLTPYQDYDIKKENILLFRGVDNEDTPPKKWKFIKEVCGSHIEGYNSDPCLFYQDGELSIFWREWETENVPKGTPYTCIMLSTTKDAVTFSSPKVVALNNFCDYSMIGDTVMCPIVISHQGVINMYASCYAYKPFLRPIGVSRYVFKDGLYKFDGLHHRDNLWFDLWHFDLFEYKGFLYQIITGQFGNAIYIGRSKDGKIFKYSKRPLYSYPWFVKKNFFYKPSGQIVDDKLYVFFPRKKKNGSLRIVMRSMNASLLESFVYI